MIKDILVHLDGDDANVAGLAMAVLQAKRFGARLTGLFARNELDALAKISKKPSEALQAAAEAAKDMFDKATEGLDTRWWQVEHGAPDDLVAELIFCSHYFDLMVVSQPTAKGLHVPATLVQQLILNAGRPILVAHEDYKGEPVGRRPVVAWRSGKQASRALHDALPLIAAAEDVLLVSVRGLTPLNEDTPRVDIVDHLRAHGLPVKGERVNTEGLGIMDGLLSRAYDHDADLLTIGGHVGKALSLSGKAGTGTRHILAHMALPVLFSA
jgi:nucleotide-binding universal stress UspA family protein